MPSEKERLDLIKMHIGKAMDNMRSGNIVLAWEHLKDVWEIFD